MHLSAQALSCSRGGRAVFSSLSFSLEAGNALILEGPNGAGKSTLLRLIAGLIQPDSGTIGLDGGDDELPIGAQCHYVGHLDAVKPALTVRQNIRFWGTYLGGAQEDGALAALRLDHLADLPAGNLSAGQGRRLALARLPAAAKPIWLLDEPTVSLDRAAQQDLISLGKAHLQSGGLIVVATHLPIDLEPANTLGLTGLN